MDRNEVKAETVTADPPRAFWLWIGLLLPPSVWLVQFQTVYLASEWACYAMDHTVNHVASVVALVISGFGIGAACSEWKAAYGGTENEMSDQETRRRFMAILGLLMGSLSIALIVATWLPTLKGVPCGK